MKQRLRKLVMLLALAPLVLSSCSGAMVSVETQTAEHKTEKPAKKQGEEGEIPTAPLADEKDKAALESLYASRGIYYGDIHCHPMAGVAKDGRKTLAEWKEKMAEAGLDFVAFLNHHQIAHMLEADWDDTIFIGGTEPQARIQDSRAAKPSVHYNMIVPSPEALYQIITSFPEYEYTGGQNGVDRLYGTFIYPGFTTARFQELIAAVKACGGLFVNAHPKQQMQSDNPLDFYFADYTGLEVFYGENGSITGEDTKANYKLWTDLLASGKRLWATAGSDSHGDATGVAVTSVYAEEKKDDAYLSHLSKGDFTCGFVGIRMAIGDAKMGSSTDFAGKRAVVSVGDFFPTVLKEGRTYTVRILTDQGVVYTASTDGKEPVTFAFDADESAAFYRVEVLDEKRPTQPIIAIGNPIWND